MISSQEKGCAFGYLEPRGGANFYQLGRLFITIADTLLWDKIRAVTDHDISIHTNSSATPVATAMKATSATALEAYHFRYYDYVMAAFVVVLLLSNIIGAAKLSQIGGFEFGAGILFFPLGYVLGDILTEVYGYARARRVIWAGFAALLFMAFMSWAVVSMPPAPGWDGQDAYEKLFGQVPRIVLASITAFWAGEFVNSFVMARMKIWTKGKHLWTRTIGSTIVGQGVDSLLFYPIAFWGVWTSEQVMTVMVTNWAMKVGWEVVLTPVTYALVGWLKRREGVDVFDDATDFTPFQTKV